MKAKLFISNLIVIAAICSSCRGPRSNEIEPTEKDLNNYITVLSHYYPYTLNDEFVFENESLGKRWENKPFVYGMDSIFPQTEIWLCDDPYASCYGDRVAGIYSNFMENGLSRFESSPSEISTYIRCNGDAYIGWHIKLSFGIYDNCSGHYSISCMPKEVLSILTDTILIPIQIQDTENERIAAPENAYARIVIGQGLTDFSTDGKTVWKRVKE